jgi:transcriptional regulator with XRE-family HTH domain
MKENIVDSPAFYILLGERIRVARNAKGLDQESFSSLLDLTRASIVNIEKGRQRPSIYQVWLMAQILDVQLIDLVPPLNVGVQISEWESKINSDSNIDDEEKKRLLEFISATRNSS